MRKCEPAGARRGSRRSGCSCRPWCTRCSQACARTRSNARRPGTAPCRNRQFHKPASWVRFRVSRQGFERCSRTLACLCSLLCDTGSELHSSPSRRAFAVCPPLLCLTVAAGLWHDSHCLLHHAPPLISLHDEATIATMPAACDAFFRPTQPARDAERDGRICCGVLHEAMLGSPSKLRDAHRAAAKVADADDATARHQAPARTAGRCPGPTGTVAAAGVLALVQGCDSTMQARPRYPAQPLRLP